MKVFITICCLLLTTSTFAQGVVMMQHTVDSNGEEHLMQVPFEREALLTHYVEEGEVFFEVYRIKEIYEEPGLKYGIIKGVHAETMEHNKFYYFIDEKNSLDYASLKTLTGKQVMLRYKSIEGEKVLLKITPI